jgi:hypothetical protein
MPISCQIDSTLSNEDGVMRLPFDIIAYVQSIPRLEDHPRKDNPRPGGMAWFGQRYDFNGLMVWTGGRW